MTRKSKRPGTRGGRRLESIGPTDTFERATEPSSRSERVTLQRPRGKRRLPTDLVDAAEAALDDMLGGDVEVDAEDAIVAEMPDDEPRTQTRSPSHDAMAASGDDEGPDEDDEPETQTAGRPSKMPLPAPPHTSPVRTLSARGTPPPPGRSTPVPTPPGATTRLSPPPRPSATPPIVRAPASPVPPVHTPTPTPVIPRQRVDVSLDASRDDAMTSERTTSLDDSLRALEEQSIGSIEHTARLPSRLDIELDTAVPDVDPEELVPVRSELPRLQVAVLEESSQLGSIRSAIAAAGHVVHVAASGRDGAREVVAALDDDPDEIDVVIAALPGGEAVIEAALALAPKRPIVIASLSRAPLDAIHRAHEAGADLVALRPHDVERIAPLLFAASRLLVEKRVALAARGADYLVRDSLELPDDPEPRSLLAFDVFERVVELELARAQRFDYPLAVALFAVDMSDGPPPAIHGILRARAGNALIHAIRDIDVATQLEQERFLVLLPYTDLKSAAVLARKVISAVAVGDPVVAGGRSFSPRVIGAVAGGAPGQPHGLAKLMKDAATALEQARRDGAELAVQP